MLAECKQMKPYYKKGGEIPIERNGGVQRDRVHMLEYGMETQRQMQLPQQTVPQQQIPQMSPMTPYQMGMQVYHPAQMHMQQPMVQMGGPGSNAWGHGMVQGQQVVQGRYDAQNGGVVNDGEAKNE